MSTSLFARGLRKIKRKQEKAQKQAARQAYKSWVRTLPIQKDLVLLEARNGHTIDGNVYYILREFVTREEFRDFSIAITAEDGQAEETIRGRLAFLARSCGDLGADSLEERIRQIRICSPNASLQDGYEQPPLGQHFILYARRFRRPMGWRVRWRHSVSLVWRWNDDRWWGWRLHLRQHIGAELVSLCRGDRS